MRGLEPPIYTNAQVAVSTQVNSCAMKAPAQADSNEAAVRQWRWLWLVVAGTLFVMFMALWHPRPHQASSNHPESPDTVSGVSISASKPETRPLRRRVAFGTESAPAPEQIVAEKVKQFGRSRRALVETIANRLNREVPAEIKAFFDAIEAGNWDEIHSRWKELATHTHQYEYSKSDRPDLEPFWQSVLDAYGVAEQAHDWPAQKLLDYGNAILGALQPGMVYVGGTDNGRWVPELLNETGGEPHIMITQNALGDGTYLDYLRELYGDRFNTLSPEDSQRAFQEYIADAQKRLEHDQQFPDEPKQVLPDEKITMKDGKASASGMVAVMGINEKLLEMLMQKNPDLAFAVQESQPMRGTYANAVPLGPLMALGVPDAQNAFTAEQAAQSVDYWRSQAQTMLADPEAAGSETTLKAYSHDVNSTANLLAAHNFTAEAEQAYGLASQIWPGNPVAVEGLAGILSRTGRATEAQQVLDNFVRNYPDQRPAIETVRGTIVGTVSAH
jgi:hypothetical protein